MFILGGNTASNLGLEQQQPLVLGLVLEAPRGQVFKSLVLVLVLVLLGPVLVLVLVLPKRSCTGLEIERTEKLLKQILEMKKNEESKIKTAVNLVLNSLASMRFTTVYLCYASTLIKSVNFRARAVFTP